MVYDGPYLGGTLHHLLVLHMDDLSDSLLISIYQKKMFLGRGVGNTVV